MPALEVTLVLFGKSAQVVLQQPTLAALYTHLRDAFDVSPPLTLLADDVGLQSDADVASLAPGTVIRVVPPTRMVFDLEVGAFSSNMYNV